MIQLCTYFDSRFLPRGLALIDSVKAHTPSFKIYILALDDACFEYLQSLQDANLEIVSLAEYKTYFSIDISKYADKKQFYFSITPNICLFIFDKYQEVDQLFYLDADLLFYQSANYLLEEMGEKSILICSHHFHPLHQLIATHYGHFNVAINGFRNDSEGLRCLQQWKSDCESWYPGMPDFPHDFFSDQIFLDKWPAMYPSLHIVKNVAIDVAPWNLNNIKITRKNGIFYADNQELIVFHFSNLQKVGANTWNTNTAKFFISIKGPVKEIFVDYINKIESYGLENGIVQALTFEPNSARFLVQKICRNFFNEMIVV